MVADESHKLADIAVLTLERGGHILLSRMLIHPPISLHLLPLQRFIAIRPTE